MPSSISSSDERLPDRPALRLWLLGFALVALTAGLWECLLRGCGFRPSVNDDAGLWALARRRVPEHDPRALVLIGASRSQFALDPAEFRLGDSTPIQLSILGSSPVPVLQHFAEDERFRGTILCDVKEIIFFNAAPERARISQEYLDHYHHLQWSGFLQLQLRAACQERLVFQNPEVTFQALRSLARGRLPLPCQRIRRDRCREGYLAGHPSLAAEQRRLVSIAQKLGRPLTEPELEVFLDTIEQNVQRIRERGGRVIFVRLPSSGSSREIEEKRFPRDEYWDRLAARTSATCIHCDDFPLLSGFECPDGSHLDRREAMEFSRALATVLVDVPSRTEE